MHQAAGHRTLCFDSSDIAVIRGTRRCPTLWMLGRGVMTLLNTFWPSHWYAVVFVGETNGVTMIHAYWNLTIVIRLVASRFASITGSPLSQSLPISSAPLIVVEKSTKCTNPYILWRASNVRPQSSISPDQPPTTAKVKGVYHREKRVSTDVNPLECFYRASLLNGKSMTQKT